jgi:type 1 fimbria pilin
MTSLTRKLTLFTALLLLSLLNMGSAHATSCNMNGIYPQLDSEYYNPRFTFPLQNDLPVGSPIGAPITKTFRFTCNPITVSGPVMYYLEFKAFRPVSTIVPNVWVLAGAGSQTGLGVRVTNVANGTILSGTTGIGNIAPPVPVGSAATEIQVALTFQLVKLGPLVANINYGQSLLGDFLQIGSRDGNVGSTFNNFNNQLEYGVDFIRFTQNTCNVSVSSATVTMPLTAPGDFGATGSTTGNQPFEINLTSCENMNNVYMSLSDASEPGNTTDQLSLAPGSSAAGVKLRILKPDGVTPIRFDPGRLNLWQVDSGVGTSLTIPLTAQYISTSPTVTPGSITAGAIFTLSYQ